MPESSNSRLGGRGVTSPSSDPMTHPVTVLDVTTSNRSKAKLEIDPSSARKERAWWAAAQWQQLPTRRHISPRPSPSPAEFYDVRLNSLFLTVDK